MFFENASRVPQTLLTEIEISMEQGYPNIALYLSRSRATHHLRSYVAFTSFRFPERGQICEARTF